MADPVLNAVAILNAIPEDEMQTSRWLCEDLSDIALFLTPTLHVRYFRILTPADVEAAMLELQAEVKKESLRPWVHLDAHGSDDGFETADGTGFSWEALKDLLIPLNIESEFNLVLVLATCFGGSFRRTIRTIDRAPLSGMVGPMREISTESVKRDFTSFYKTLFDTNSFKDAFGALSIEQQPDFYFLTSPMDFFIKVWISYKELYCTDEKLDERAADLYREAQECPGQTPSIGSFKSELRSREKYYFDKFRDKYFMHDLSEKNKERFPLTYEEAEKIYKNWATHHRLRSS